jgi:hypothetical protein
MNEPKEKDTKAPEWLAQVQKEVDAETLEADLNAVRSSTAPKWLRDLSAKANGIDVNAPLPDWLRQEDLAPATAPEPEPQHSDQSDQNEPTA